MNAAVLAAHAGMQQENSKLEGGKLLLRCVRRPEVHNGERGCGDCCDKWFCPSENTSDACKGGVNNDGVNIDEQDHGDGLKWHPDMEGVRACALDSFGPPPLHRPATARFASVQEG